MTAAGVTTRHCDDSRALRWILAHKLAFFFFPALILVFGILVTIGKLFE